jgi:ferredoxin-NADP reductase
MHGPLLPEDLAAPMVFISGGVGLTPLVSMLQELLERDFSYPITWLHGCRNRSVHAFKAQVDDVIAKHDRIVQHIFYDDTTELDRWEGIMEGFNLKAIKAMLKALKVPFKPQGAVLPPHVINSLERGVKEYENGETISLAQFKEKHFSK